MFIEMKLKSLAFDPALSAFAVLLTDLDETQTLPIRIEALEANAIAMKAKGVHLRRPMTHDLIHNILRVFNADIVKVQVMDVRDSTYYSQIVIQAEGKEMAIDCRPSDAIALAIAESVPIHVAEEVLSKAKTIELDRLESWLESLDPEDIQYTA